MTTKQPTPEEWIELRPQVTRWYLNDQRTARWISEEIRRTRGLSVTTKMLRDRFRAWNLRAKYNRTKRRSGKDGEARVERQLNGRKRMREPVVVPVLDSIFRSPVDQVELSPWVSAAIPDAVDALEAVGSDANIPWSLQESGTVRQEGPGIDLASVVHSTSCNLLNPSVFSNSSRSGLMGNSQVLNLATSYTGDRILIPTWLTAWPVVDVPVGEAGNTATHFVFRTSGRPRDIHPIFEQSNPALLSPTVPITNTNTTLFVDLESFLEVDESLLNNATDTSPPRALDTAEHDRPLARVLKSIHDYFDNLTSRIIKRYPQQIHVDEDQAFAVQRVAANAHQAIASQKDVSPKAFDELRKIGNQVVDVLPRLDVKSMHPRVLTVLLRLIVDGNGKTNGNAKQGSEPNALTLVKRLFEKISTARLFGNHPVALLFSLPEDPVQTNQLLHHQLELAKWQFYDKIRLYEPLLVAWEEIYCARVLTSLGFIDEAEALLQSVFQNLTPVSSNEEMFAHADACRTLGFAQINTGSYEAAKASLYQALKEFEASGYGVAENVLYTHLVFSLAYRKTNDLEMSEKSLRKALEIWTSNNHLRQNQSAVKIISDLDKVLRDQGKFNDAKELRIEFPTYFDHNH